MMQMTDNKRFEVVDKPIGDEPFLYKVMVDKLTSKDYNNTLKGIDDMAELCNSLWEQTKMFENHNQLLVADNEKLRDNMDSFKKEVMTVIARYWKKNGPYLTISEVLELILKDLDLELIL